MRYILILIASLLLVCNAEAQVRFNLNFNLDRQPVWGPVGADYAENYYLPDIEAYYNVPTKRFYFNMDGRWVYRSSLPSRYRNFDLYNSYKVVVNERNPWHNHEKYRDEYSSYKGRRDQLPIRDSRDSKYFVNRNHPEHNNWVRQQGNGNNNRDGMKNQNNNNGKDKSDRQNGNQGNNKNKNKK